MNVVLELVITKYTICVGVTTAPRKEPTLDIMLESLDRLDNVTIFAEPGSQQTQGIRRKERHIRLGAWKNWFYTLKELGGQADFVVILQDDIILRPGAIDWAINNRPQDKKLGCLSLFTPPMYCRIKGWNKIEEGSHLWMAQALIFSQEVIPSILESRAIWRFDGEAQIDNRLGVWAKYSGYNIYYHNPSLCEHIGATSTIWPDAKLEGERISGAGIELASANL